MLQAEAIVGVREALNLNIDKMEGLKTNAADIGTQPQTTVEASKQDVVGGTYELLQIHKDVVHVRNLPSASLGQDVAADYSSSANIGVKGDLEEDSEAEENQEKFNPHKLSGTTEAAFLPSTEDILPRNLLVDASKQYGVQGTCELLQISKDVIRVEVMNLPSASLGQDVAVDYSRSTNIGVKGDLEDDLEAEEHQEEFNPDELSGTTEATFLPSTEDILPRKLIVDAGDQGTSEVSRSMMKESKSVITEENAILQKLLRRSRYFDCGDVNIHLEGHAVNSTTQSRRKPCYVCGDLQHTGKKCHKRRTCYMCNGKGHIAEDCPKSDQKFDICLRCGESGHGLFSCSNGYSSGDLKNIRCYICNEVGHLCCGSYVYMDPATVSCYNCGESGHSGLQCPKPRVEKCSSQPPSICYKCGEQGHIARKCINNPEGAVLNQCAQSATLDLIAEPNDGCVYKNRRKVRKSKTYRYGRAKKLKMKALTDSITEQ